MRNSSRTPKHHPWNLFRATAARPAYPHVEIVPTFEQRRTLHIPFKQTICSSCLVFWPCVAFQHDEQLAKAELRAYFAETYGHATAIAATVAA